MYFCKEMGDYGFAVWWPYSKVLSAAVKNRFFEP